MGCRNSVHAGRNGLARYVFSFVYPRHAKAAILQGETLILESPFRSMVIPYLEIEESDVVQGWFWGGIRVRLDTGRVRVSGLSKPGAEVFDAALVRARSEAGDGQDIP